MLSRRLLRWDHGGCWFPISTRKFPVGTDQDSLLSTVGDSGAHYHRLRSVITYPAYRKVILERQLAKT